MCKHVLSKSLRARRREWGITQREMAKLLGYEDRAQVSRIERGKGIPNVELGIACELLFEHSLRELFPSLYIKVKKRILEELSALSAKMCSCGRVSTIRKKVIINRAITRIKQ